jgi:hypothetical protein
VDETPDRAAERRLALLVRTSHALDVRLDPEIVLRTVAELLVPDFVDACEISVVTGNVFERIVAAAGVGRDMVKQREQTSLTVDSDHPIASVVRTGEPVFVDIDGPEADYYFGPRGSRLTARAGGLTALAMVPLTGRRSVLGVLSIGMGPSGRSFGPDDVEVLTVVGRRVAVSVENAQLYERVRRQSHTLQRALLPDDLPEDDWFDVAGRYRPGTDGDEVGGDWYDAHYSETGELTFTIGDVAGRGLEAAAVMGQLRSAIAALELDRHGPAVVLDRLDRVRTRNDSHATVLYGSLAKDGRLRYSSAGHLPPVVITAGGASILPTKPAPPVGMRTHVGARLHEHFLARGDAVVLYTDGLIERRGQLIDDGLARLQQAASSMIDATADEIADGLLHTLISDDSDDDVALLALKFRG